MDQLLNFLSGVATYLDDTFISAETIQEYNKNLKVFKRLIY